MLETPIYFLGLEFFLIQIIVQLVYLAITKCKGMFVSKTMNLNLVRDILLHHQLNPLLFYFINFTLVAIKNILNDEIKNKLTRVNLLN